MRQFQIEIVGLDLNWIRTDTAHDDVMVWGAVVGVMYLLLLLEVMSARMIVFTVCSRGWISILMLCHRGSCCCAWQSIQCGVKTTMLAQIDSTRTTRQHTNKLHLRLGRGESSIYLIEWMYIPRCIIIFSGSFTWLALSLVEDENVTDFWWALDWHRWLLEAELFTSLIPYWWSLVLGISKYSELPLECR